MQIREYFYLVVNRMCSSYLTCMELHLVMISTDGSQKKCAVAGLRTQSLVGLRAFRYKGRSVRL